MKDLTNLISNAVNLLNPKSNVIIEKGITPDAGWLKERSVSICEGLFVKPEELQANGILLYTGGIHNAKYLSYKDGIWKEVTLRDQFKKFHSSCSLEPGLVAVTSRYFAFYSKPPSTVQGVKALWLGQDEIATGNLPDSEPLATVAGLANSRRSTYFSSILEKAKTKRTTTYTEAETNPSACAEPPLPSRFITLQETRPVPSKPVREVQRTLSAESYIIPAKQETKIVKLNHTIPDFF